MRSMRSWACIIGAATVMVSVTACGDEDASKQTFVQARQVEQWIVNHECNRSGAMKGYPGYGGEGMGQIARETFLCDNGKTFLIVLMTDGTYKYTKQ